MNDYRKIEPMQQTRHELCSHNKELLTLYLAYSSTSVTKNLLIIRNTLLKHYNYNQST